MFWKKYTWLFPFLGGIIVIIGLLTPIASYYNYLQIWMWGLIVTRFYGISVEFVNDTLIFNIGIISSIILTIFSLILIITGYLYKRGHFDNNRISKIWISSGIIILTATIIPLITLDFYDYDLYVPMAIWVFCDPGFGAIGPIIGAILAIAIGVMVFYSRAGRRQAPIPVSVVAPKNVCPHCGKPISLNASFCSSCGKTIEKSDI